MDLAVQETDMNIELIVAVILLILVLAALIFSIVVRWE